MVDHSSPYPTANYSIGAPQWRGLPTGCRDVLEVLDARQLNHDWVEVGYEALATDMCCSRRQAIRRVKAALESGFLELLAEGAGRRKNRYRVINPVRQQRSPSRALVSVPALPRSGDIEGTAAASSGDIPVTQNARSSDIRDNTRNTSSSNIKTLNTRRAPTGEDSGSSRLDETGWGFRKAVRAVFPEIDELTDRQIGLRIAAMLDKGWAVNALADLHNREFGHRTQSVRNPEKVLRYRMADLCARFPAPLRQGYRQQWCGQCDEITRMVDVVIDAQDGSTAPAHCPGCSDHARDRHQPAAPWEREPVTAAS